METMMPRLGRWVLLSGMCIGAVLGAEPLRGDDTWEGARRDSARKAAEEAVSRWNPFQPFTFKIGDDVYSRSVPPKHSPLYVFYPEHFGRRNVLQMHPYDLEVPNGIEAKVRVPPQAGHLRFLVAGHDHPGVDVGWDVKINGRVVLSEILKTGGQWKVVRVPIREYAGQEVVLRIEARATGWNFEFLFLGAVGFAGDLFTADGRILELSFEQFAPESAKIDVGGARLGGLECVVAQFEKEGLGYKKTGVGWAEADDVTKVQVIESKPDRCVVEVTVQRTHSEETKRAFEATCRFTMYAGQNWFEARLVAIRNTDKVAYEVRGYGHRLRPADAAAEPVGFPDCVGAICRPYLLGALARTPDDFGLAMLSRGAGGYGEITRKLSAKLAPGAEWKGDDEPALVVFTGKGSNGAALFKAAQTTRSASAAPSSIGEIHYHEEKETAQ